ncbi:polyprenyl synthetase family protein [Candidatus Fermentibacterales bacterium]|nr:polyprenyl synthetase family protein [Candidatus Fermentibacterales bacterium]
MDRGLSVLFDDRASSWSVLGTDARHTVDAGGKRIRPFLVRTACQALGQSASTCLPAACSVELVHAYSLIHDDLPCMDDDDTRRGVPTLHVLRGAPRATLAADWLLVTAFEVLLSSTFSPGTVSRMISRLARAAGPCFLVAGQHRDLAPPSCPDTDWVEKVQRGKTSAMIRVSLELGALAGGAEADLLDRLGPIGDDLGVLFQITDDMLDVTSSSEELGKRTGKDSSHGKATHVALLGVDETARLARGIADRICDACAALDGDWGLLSQLALYLPGRRR